LWKLPIPKEACQKVDAHERQSIAGKLLKQFDLIFCPSTPSRQKVNVTF
jgi:hypothetical protein